MQTTRREMICTAALLGGTALVGSQFTSFASAQDVTANDANYAIQLGWKIGPQIYSFNRFPFDEAIKLVKKCNVSSFELFSGQKLSKDINVSVGPDLLKPENKDAFKRFRELLAESGAVPHSMGVCPANRAHFDFAAELRMPNLNCEPGFNSIPEVDKLANEYGIKVGFHNHPKSSIYWDPQIVLDHIKDASPMLGSCADTGHWLRSGLDPVECVKKLKGHIFAFHIKDLDENKRDVPLGKGACKIAEILKECAAQKVTGPFSIEYESDWDNNQPLVAEGIAFFRATAKAIVLG
jgi:sugar phosphate isomerase/epimerase